VIFLLFGSQITGICPYSSQIPALCHKSKAAQFHDFDFLLLEKKTEQRSVKASKQHQKTAEIFD